jgi:hypothetical protein
MPAPLCRRGNIEAKLGATRQRRTGNTVPVSQQLVFQRCPESRVKSVNLRGAALPAGAKCRTATNSEPMPTPESRVIA